MENRNHNRIWRCGSANYGDLGIPSRSSWSWSWSALTPSTSAVTTLCRC